jgi:hypothetical protein
MIVIVTAAQSPGKLLALQNRIYAFDVMNDFYAFNILCATRTCCSARQHAAACHARFSASAQPVTAAINLPKVRPKAVAEPSGNEERARSSRAVTGELIAS